MRDLSIPCSPVEFDEAAGFIDALLFIEGGGIDFGGDARPDAFQNFRTEINRQLVTGFRQPVVPRFALLP